MFRGVERAPAGLRLGLLLVVGLVAVTISQIEYSGTLAERNRALERAATTARIVGELRRANALLVSERDAVGREAGAAEDALEDAKAEVRRWRRIAATRERDSARTRRHR